MLEGLIIPDSGTVRIFNEPPAKVLSRVGVVFQETNLYKRYTVRETLELFASFYAKSLPVEQVMQRVAIADKSDQRIMTLSGGQKQRLYIGCSLIHDPDILFVDEPTTGLDPQARLLIWDLLLEFKRSGKSLFLTTHYLEEAERLADWVAIMDHGKIIAEGTTADLIKKYTPTTAFTVETTDDLAKTTLASRILAKTDGRYRLQAPQNSDDWHKVFSALSQVSVTALEMHPCTLEDVFVQLTGRSIRDA
jgi:ABC-2 type transport system ATP-binding protein